MGPAYVREGMEENSPAGQAIRTELGEIIVGTKSREFVSIGAQVKEGDTLMIVEAMKTMNHIPSPRSGTVKRILVDDGNPVEFGSPLMVVE